MSLNHLLFCLQTMSLLFHSLHPTDNLGVTILSMSFGHSLLALPPSNPHRASVSFLQHKCKPEQIFQRVQWLLIILRIKDKLLKILCDLAANLFSANTEIISHLSQFTSHLASLLILWCTKSFPSYGLCRRFLCLKCSESESHLTLWDPMDCSLPSSSVHGILQARTLEWVAVPFSRGSSQPRNPTQVSRIAGEFFTIWATRAL